MKDPTVTPARHRPTSRQHSNPHNAIGRIALSGAALALAACASILGFEDGSLGEPSGVGGDGAGGIGDGGGGHGGSSCQPSATFMMHGALGNERPLRVLIADLDADEDADIVTVAPNRAWLNDGAGNLVETGQVIGQGGDQTLGAAVEDIDGDGDVDIAHANYAGQTNRVWLNDGAGSFTEASFNVGESESTYAVLLVDFNGDTDLDALTVNETSQGLRLRLNEGSGVFPTYVQIAAPATGSYGQTVAFDADEDGDVDIVAINTGGPTEVWLNDGAAQFTLGPTFGDASLVIAAADLNGDGADDLITAPNDGPGQVWLNAGSGMFNAGSTPVLGMTRAIALGDVDADGDIDIVAGTIQGPDVVWLNDGAASFTGPSATLDATDTGAIALGDFDADCDLDVVAGTGVAMHLWWNQ